MLCTYLILELRECNVNLCHFSKHSTIIQCHNKLTIIHSFIYVFQVPLGLIFRNENTEMKDILEYLVEHYVPTSPEETKVCDDAQHVARPVEVCLPNFYRLTNLELLKKATILN